MSATTKQRRISVAAESSRRNRPRSRVRSALQANEEVASHEWLALQLSR